MHTLAAKHCICVSKLLQGDIMWLQGYVLPFMHLPDGVGALMVQEELVSASVHSLAVTAAPSHLG
jgi:hypothetical protein